MNVKENPVDFFLRLDCKYLSDIDIVSLSIAYPFSESFMRTPAGILVSSVMLFGCGVSVPK